MDNADFYIAPFLNFGAENAIKRKDLRKMVGVSDRELRKYIELDRLHGALIINDGNGYYRAARKTELNNFLKVNRARAKSINAWCDEFEATEETLSDR